MIAGIEGIRLPAIGLLAILVAGCAGSPPSNLYTLSAIGTAASESQSLQAPPAVIAIGPVSLPDYLDRPHIVTRQSAYELELAANDRWAAPLYDMLPRVLVEDLALRLPSDRIVSFPETGDASFDYRVAVQVSRFDVDAAGEAALATRWQFYAIGAAGAAGSRRHAAATGRRPRVRCLRGFAQRRARRARRPHRPGGEFGSRFRRSIARHPLISAHGDAGLPRHARCGRAPGSTRLVGCYAPGTSLARCTTPRETLTPVVCLSLDRLPHEAIMTDAQLDAQRLLVRPSMRLAAFPAGGCVPVLAEGHMVHSMLTLIEERLKESGGHSHLPVKEERVVASVSQ